MRKAVLVGGLLGLPAVLGVSHEIPKVTVDHVIEPSVMLIQLLLDSLFRTCVPRRGE